MGEHANNTDPVEPEWHKKLSISDKDLLWGKLMPSPFTLPRQFTREELYYFAELIWEGYKKTLQCKTSTQTH